MKTIIKTVLPAPPNYITPLATAQSWKSSSVRVGGLRMLSRRSIRLSIFAVASLPLVWVSFFTSQSAPERFVAVIDGLVNRDPAIREQAKRDFRELGTNALPAIIARLRLRPSWIDRQIERLATTCDWFPFNPEPIINRHAPAVAACYLLGPQAKPAASDLAALLFVAPTAQVAIALSSIGEATASPVCRAVAAHNPDTRYFGMLALAGLCKRWPETELSAYSLDHASSALRHQIPEEALTALIQNLVDSDVRIRAAAAWTLAEIGPVAGAAVPALRQALNDTVPMVRSQAEQALTRIQKAVVIKTSKIEEPLALRP